MTGTPDHNRLRWERGTVTAEAAIVLPLIAAVCLALVWMVSIGIIQVRAVDLCSRRCSRAGSRRGPFSSSRGRTTRGSRRVDGDLRRGGRRRHGLGCGPSLAPALAARADAIGHGRVEFDGRG